MKIVMLLTLMLFAAGCGVRTERQSERVRDVIAACYAHGGRSYTESFLGGVHVTCDTFVYP